MNRRRFLKNTAIGLTTLALPGGRVWASGRVPADMKLVVVFAPGGWDPTRVLFSDFALSHIVDFEVGAEVSTAGNIPFVDHPDRPTVRAFIQDNHHRMLVCNGVMVRSIAHDICTSIAMTGTTTGALPDWPAIIGAHSAEKYALPHLVLRGPSFAGEHVGIVARAGESGQLDGLLSGDILEASDVPVGHFSGGARRVLDRYLSRRAAARVGSSVTGVDADLAAAFEEATERSGALKDYQERMDFRTSSDLTQQAEVGVNALAVGLSRCVTLGHDGMWDTHVNNDSYQSPLWEDLFGGLSQLMAALDSAPGTVGPTLADQTVVMVLSEMGRAPQLNSSLGKDHWPYTSMMLLGPGLTSDRVVGGLDGGYMGEHIQFSDGEIDAGGELLTVEALGATLLEVMGLDPAEYISHTSSIAGLLG